MYHKLNCSIDSTENQYHLGETGRLHMQMLAHWGT